MKIVVDESVSYGVVSFLKKKGYEIIAIAEGKLITLYKDHVKIR